MQYVQTQLDGGVSIPPRDQARTKKWKNKAKKRDARKEQADEIKEVAELADQPTSYTLATLPSGSCSSPFLLCPFPVFHRFLVSGFFLTACPSGSAR